MQPDRNQEYTYRDYLTWPENEHWELIDGNAYPAYGPTALASPNREHQTLVRKLLLAIGNYLEGKTCEVFTSPFDVVFEESEDTNTVVQPDIIVVCDPGKIREKCIVGAPDIAIEVLSPSTAPKDWIKKLHLYESQGVQEYWIVSPEQKAIYQNILKDGKYETGTFIEGVMPSEVLEGFSLDIDALLSA